ncbi:MAG: zinc ABC transporter substrate-binding protein [Pseudomonadota bacterium]
MTTGGTLRSAMLCAALMLFISSVSAKERDYRIVASFSILGSMVEAVAGDLAEIRTIVGPDTDAHVYQPSIADARTVAQADLVFVNGLGFETWANTLISESGTEARVYVATDGIVPLEVNGTIDPHAWNSLVNGMAYVRNIASAMSESMPEHAEEFAARSESYLSKLAELDRETRSRVAGLPANRRTVVTAHDAFGYLADAYGLEFLAPQGIDTDSEPSARDLAALIDQLRDGGAAALFVENISSPALVQQISNDTGIAIGGRLFSDALSERGGPATSYLAMFRHNLNALLSALEQPKRL